jgi:hypothetical protein
VGGPPPAEVFWRDALVVLAGPLSLLLAGFWLPRPLRLLALVLSLALASGMSLVMRRRWWRQQSIRVVGNVLEHRDGLQIARLALTRAVLRSAAAAPGVLILLLDDGRLQLAVGRRAEPHELASLPVLQGPYLELEPDDFEEVRIAAQRSYAQA